RASDQRRRRRHLQGLRVLRDRLQGQARRRRAEGRWQGRREEGRRVFVRETGDEARIEDAGRVRSQERIEACFEERFEVRGEPEEGLRFEEGLTWRSACPARAAASRPRRTRR